MEILMVLTSHDQLGDTGRKTGFWLEELAAPYYAFRTPARRSRSPRPRAASRQLDPKSNERLTRPT